MKPEQGKHGYHPNDVPNDIPNNAYTWNRNSSLNPVITEDQFQAYSKKYWRDIRRSKIKPTIGTKMLVSYYVASQINYKKENFTWRTQQENAWIKITASRLSYELGLYGKKNFNGNCGIL